MFSMYLNLHISFIFFCVINIFEATFRVQEHARCPSVNVVHNILFLHALNNRNTQKLTEVSFGDNKSGETGPCWQAKIKSVCL